MKIIINNRLILLTRWTFKSWRFRASLRPCGFALSAGRYSLSVTLWR